MGGGVEKFPALLQVGLLIREISVVFLMIVSNLVDNLLILLSTLNCGDGGSVLMVLRDDALLEDLWNASEYSLPPLIKWTVDIPLLSSYRIIYSLAFSQRVTILVSLSLGCEGKLMYICPFQSLAHRFKVPVLWQP